MQSETEGEEDEPQQLGLPRELPHPVPALHLLLPQLPDPDPALVPHPDQQPPVQQPARLHGRLPSRAPVKEILQRTERLFDVYDYDLNEFDAFFLDLYVILAI